MSQRKQDFATRFWSKVDQSGGPDACWPFNGAKHKFGYGMFQVSTGRCDGAHRVAYRLTYGSIPEGLLIRHHCDNPSCCNPIHLLPGTYADNMQDKVVRGRANPPRGERNAFHKYPELARPGELHIGARFTNAEARDIREEHRIGRKITQIARERGVPHSVISNIVRNNTYKEESHG